METTHDELKGNTIIIGALSFISLSTRTRTCTSPDFGKISVWGLWGSREKEGALNRLLQFLPSTREGG
jgi:hypothetical protein